jgi:hypothetical protein
MNKKEAREDKKRKLTEEELELLETGKTNIDWNEFLKNLLK